MTRIERTILGIDPGLANTGWGIVEQRGPRLACTAYGCVSTPARGAALVACAECDLEVLEFSPSQIKLAVVGTGSAEKDQVQYMVRQLLALEDVPRPDHAADALAAAICYTTHEGFARRTGAACMAYDAPVCNVPVGKDRP